MNEKQLTFEGVMRIVQGNKWILLKDIERLEKFIQNQQATIQSLKEENEQLRKQLDFYLLDEFEWKEKYGDCDKDE